MVANRLTLKDVVRAFKLEMAGTGAVYDGTKPKDGGGFNWWGAVGDPLGVSITGDPIKKGKHGRPKRKRSKK